MKHFTTILLSLLLSLLLAASFGHAKPTKRAPLKAPAGVNQEQFDDLSYPYQDDIEAADSVEVFGE